MKMQNEPRNIEQKISNYEVPHFAIVLLQTIGRLTLRFLVRYCPLTNQRTIGTIFVLLLALTGCAGHQAALDTQAPAATPLVPATPRPATPGSLWTDQQGGLFSDLKARNVGDILTVAIYEKASASKEANTETGRESNVSADITALMGMESNITKINKAIDPAKLLDVGYKSDFTGNGKTSRKEDLVATLTTRVVEVLPNGNLRIQGGKSVTVNNEDQIISLTGIVRPADISPKNMVDSKYILDADIDYTGKGVISDKQRPGWLARILDNIWPF